MLLACSPALCKPAEPRFEPGIMAQFGHALLRRGWIEGHNSGLQAIGSEQRRLVPHENAQHFEITPELVLKAYAAGIFPMSEGADDPNIHWIEPRLRGIMPLDAFHVPRRLARTVRAEPYEIRFDADFDAVIAACAGTREGAQATWINGKIRTLYRKLFDQGNCHTVAVYGRDGGLAGGLYGVSLGAAFFGESMFHIRRDASKVALVHLAARLRRGGFLLHDTQFQTSHLQQFGTVEVPRREYKAMLAKAVAGRAEFTAAASGEAMSGAEALGILARAG